MSFQLFILSFHFTDLILGAAFVVAAVNAGRCLHCLSGKFGSDKPFRIARYGNDINNNYNKVKNQAYAGERWMKK